MKITLINASPKKRGSFSGYVLNEMITLLKPEAEPELLSMSLWDDDFFDEICESDALVFAFPLYCDGLPSSFLRLLMAFEAKLEEHPASIKVYGIVNCGFLEGTQCRYALEILEHFCKKAGLSYCGGIALGGGPFIHEMQSAPWKFRMKRDIYEAMVNLTGTIKSENTLDGNQLVTPKIPRFLYLKMANHQWVTGAKQNSLRKKDIYRQPK